MQRLRLFLLIFALVAGFTGGWQSASATPVSHAAGGCHDDGQPARPGSPDATAAQHPCLGCGVLAERPVGVVSPLAGITGPQPERLAHLPANHSIGPDTPPPRPLA